MATDLGITLAVPAAVLEEAWRLIDAGRVAWLELLGQVLPVVVLDLD